MSEYHNKSKYVLLFCDAMLSHLIDGSHSENGLLLTQTASRARRLESQLLIH
jgi:hypothetical protein